MIVLNQVKTNLAGTYNVHKRDDMYGVALHTDMLDVSRYRRLRHIIFTLYWNTESVTGQADTAYCQRQRVVSFLVNTQPGCSHQSSGMVQNRLHYRM